MKRIIFHISLLFAAAVMQTNAADSHKERPIIEPLKDWVYSSDEENDGFDGFLEDVDGSSYFTLKKLSTSEDLQVSTDTLVKVGPYMCEAFAYKTNESGGDDILQVRFNYKDVVIHGRAPIRGNIDKWHSIIHYKNIRDINASYHLMQALIKAVQEDKNNRSDGEVRKCKGE